MHPALPRAAMAGLGAALACLCLTASAGAHGMKPLNDSALSDVRGGDGLSFDLSNFALSGDARYTYTTPDQTASAYMGNLSASRSDSLDPFSDPYRLDLVAGAAGQADVVKLAFPINADASQKWQLAYDWGVTANGIAVDGGSVLYTDAVFSGGGMQWSTPRFGDGIAFGMGLRLDIGNLAFQGQRTGANAPMNLTGVHIDGLNADGSIPTTPLPWVIADVATQPGAVNVVTDADGTPHLHIGIGWPDAGHEAPLGRLRIDNLTFANIATPSQSVNLGASSIGSMQIQYLDIKFK